MAFLGIRPPSSSISIAFSLTRRGRKHSQLTSPWWRRCEYSAMIDLDRHTSDADPAALFIDGQQMSLVPNIRYGTAEYPERVARRLRAANIAASIGFSCSAFFAVWRFFDGSAHWKYVSLVALGYAVVPLLHRFGAL